MKKRRKGERRAAPPIGYYVYELTDPRTAVGFYVGKGKGRRAWTHEGAVRSGKEINGRKAEVIGALLREGLRPAIRIVQEGLTEREAFRLEREMIAARRSELTNISGGSVTPLESVQAKARENLLSIKPLATWLRERPRTEAQVALYHRVVDGLRRIVDMVETPEAMA